MCIKNINQNRMHVKNIYALKVFSNILFHLDNPYNIHFSALRPPPQKSIICYGQQISHWIIISVAISILLGLGAYYYFTSYTSQSAKTTEIKFIDNRASESNLNGESKMFLEEL